MAWGSDTAATQLSSITTEQFFNQVPTLNPRETAHVQVSVDFPASPTDHAIVAVYTTPDDTSEVWDLSARGRSARSRLARALKMRAAPAQKLSSRAVSWWARATPCRPGRRGRAPGRAGL